MLSREVNWKDRNTCILFGDGCGVAIVGRAEESSPSKILSRVLSSDGTGGEFFDQPIGGAVTPISEAHIQEGSHFMQMKGKEMFRVATRTLAENGTQCLELAGINLSEVIIGLSLIKPISESSKQRLNSLDIDMDKMIVNIDKVRQYFCGYCSYCFS
jgi:3-oxoacyl-[acyl-carrier-protein] synthase-3